MRLYNNCTEGNEERSIRIHVFCVSFDHSTIRITLSSTRTIKTFFKKKKKICEGKIKHDL